MALFLRLSNTEPEERNRYDEIVENACSYIEGRIADNTTENDLERIEFACAAVALYDNTLLKLINDKTLCTADGRQTLSYKDSDAYGYASKLREHAIDSIADIWVCDEGFCFKAAEG